MFGGVRYHVISFTIVTISITVGESETIYNLMIQCYLSPRLFLTTCTHILET